MRNKRIASIRFDVDEELYGLASETVWVNHMGKDRYRIRNIPMLQCNISKDDIVSAVHLGNDPCPTFQRTIIKSGNRTLRIVLERPIEGDANEILERLRELGCQYEGFDKQFFAINVPVRVNLEEVILELEESLVTWELTDPSPC